MKAKRVSAGLGEGGGRPAFVGINTLSDQGGIHPSPFDLEMPEAPEEVDGSINTYRRLIANASGDKRLEDAISGLLSLRHRTGRQVSAVLELPDLVERRQNGLEKLLACRVDPEGRTVAEVVRDLEKMRQGLVSHRTAMTSLYLKLRLDNNVHVPVQDIIESIPFRQTRSTTETEVGERGILEAFARSLESDLLRKRLVVLNGLNPKQRAQFVLFHDIATLMHGHVMFDKSLVNEGRNRWREFHAMAQIMVFMHAWVTNSYPNAQAQTPHGRSIPAVYNFLFEETAERDHEIKEQVKEFIMCMYALILPDKNQNLIDFNNHGKMWASAVQEENIILGLKALAEKHRVFNGNIKKLFELIIAYRRTQCHLYTFFPEYTGAPEKYIENSPLRWLEDFDSDLRANGVLESDQKIRVVDIGAGSTLTTDFLDIYGKVGDVKLVDVHAGKGVIEKEIPARGKLSSEEISLVGLDTQDVTKDVIDEALKECNGRPCFMILQRVSHEAPDQARMLQYLVQQLSVKAPGSRLWITDPTWRKDDAASAMMAHWDTGAVNPNFMDIESWQKFWHYCKMIGVDVMCTVTDIATRAGNDCMTSVRTLNQVNGRKNAPFAVTDKLSDSPSILDLWPFSEASDEIKSQLVDLCSGIPYPNHKKAYLEELTRSLYSGDIEELIEMYKPYSKEELISVFRHDKDGALVSEPSKDIEGVMPVDFEVMMRNEYGGCLIALIVILRQRGIDLTDIVKSDSRWKDYPWDRIKSAN